MTIDERLEKLAERHEALAQSVELLTADVRQMAAENRKMFEQIMEGMARLLHIAEIREHRIQRLEEGRK